MRRRGFVVELENQIEAAQGGGRIAGLEIHLAEVEERSGVAGIERQDGLEIGPGQVGVLQSAMYDAELGQHRCVVGAELEGGEERLFGADIVVGERARLAELRMGVDEAGVQHEDVFEKHDRLVVAKLVGE